MITTKIKEQEGWVKRHFDKGHCKGCEHLSFNSCFGWMETKNECVKFERGDEE